MDDNTGKAFDIVLIGELPPDMRTGSEVMSIMVNMELVVSYISLKHHLSMASSEGLDLQHLTLHNQVHIKFQPHS